MLRDDFAGSGGETSAEVGTHQVLCFGVGLRLDFEELPVRDELSSEVAQQINFRVDGVECGGMVTSQFKLCGTAITGTGSTLKNPSGGLLADSFQPSR